MRALTRSHRSASTNAGQAGSSEVTQSPVGCQRCRLVVPGSGVGGVEQLVAAPLPAHDLVAEVAGVGQDRPDRGAAPHPGRARMPGGADLARARESFALEDGGDAPVAELLVEHLEDALHDWRRVRVGFEDSELDPGGGLLALRVGDRGVDEPVAVVRSSTEPTASGPVSEHGVVGPDL